ncbi:MAG TPA: cytochrome c [Anaerolineales bacterium]|nr:cytochrome c [Anaerolineales bacterium]
MDDTRKIVYGLIIGFLVVVGGFVALITLASCGYSLNNCNAALPKPDRTSIPTLVPATLPASIRYLRPTPTSFVSLTPGVESNVPHPSNPGGPGQAVNLTGNADSGKQIFAANCVPCHGTEGTGGVVNPGSERGTVPTLNPIDPNLVNADFKSFATNLDLFLEHGSTPKGPQPFRSMPAWGDSGALTPQQIADVIAYVISLNK